jgi:hypothetical protein
VVDFVWKLIYLQLGVFQINFHIKITNKNIFVWNLHATNYMVLKTGS